MNSSAGRSEPPGAPAPSHSSAWPETPEVRAELELRNYEILHKEAREEIRLRLNRDSGLQTQLIASIGAVVGLSAVPGAGNLVLVAPLVGIYFAIVIAHNRWMIAKVGFYLRTTIEPALTRLTGVPLSDQWEHYLSARSRPWHRSPGVEPLLGWASFVPTYVYLGSTHSLGWETFILTGAAYSVANVAETLYVLIGLRPDW
jgi:hypothetical protein